MSILKTREELSKIWKKLPEYANFLKGSYIAIVILICLGTMFVTNMPVVSCDDITICNTNLAEFDALGAIPVIMPILLPTVMLSHMRKGTKELVYVATFILSAVSHARATEAGYMWLTQVTDGVMKHHPGLQLLPILLLTIFILCFVYEHINFRNVMAAWLKAAEPEEEEEEVSTTE